MRNSEHIVEPARPDSDLQKIARTFTKGINGFYAKSSGDFLQFCEFLGEDPNNEYTEAEFRRFQQWVAGMNDFGAERLARMIEIGTDTQSRNF